MLSLRTYTPRLLTFHAQRGSYLQECRLSDCLGLLAYGRSLCYVRGAHSPVRPLAFVGHKAERIAATHGPSKSIAIHATGADGSVEDRWCSFYQNKCFDVY